MSCCHSIIWFDQILFVERCWTASSEFDFEATLIRMSWSNNQPEGSSSKFRQMYRKRVFLGNRIFSYPDQVADICKDILFSGTLDVASQRLSGVIFLLDTVQGIHLNANRRGFTILFHSSCDGNFLQTEIGVAGSLLALGDAPRNCSSEYGGCIWPARSPEMRHRNAVRNSDVMRSVDSNSLETDHGQSVGHTPLC